MTTSVSFPVTSSPPASPPLRLVPALGPTRPSPSVEHPAMIAAANRQRAEHCFLAWLANPVKPDEVQLMGKDGPISVTSLLHLVRTSRRPLSDRDAATLGMPAGTTIGAAATELVLAVH